MQSNQPKGQKYNKTIQPSLYVSSSYLKGSNSEDAILKIYKQKKTRCLNGTFWISTLLPCIKMALCNFRTIWNDICRAGNPSCEAAHKYLFNKHWAPTPCGFLLPQSNFKIHQSNPCESAKSNAANCYRQYHLKFHFLQCLLNGKCIWSPWTGDWILGLQL